MVAQEKSIRFGSVLAASLFVLVLPRCADVSESGSSQRVNRPRRPQPPRQQSATLLLGSQPTANPPSPICSDLSTSQRASANQGRQRVCTLRGSPGYRRVQADPQRPDRVLARQPWRRV